MSWVVVYIRSAKIRKKVGRTNYELGITNYEVGIGNFKYGFISEKDEVLIQVRITK
jgi:hypothetical protein